ncbi:protein-export membrane protein SecF [Mycolicibacterium chitae]|uniref:Protein-export membrane protein SecF n=3 Tax=Mycobacteriaceae TaxID=1762 RepID=A0A3S4T1D4_MYCCI|nr:protein-export membrane protein SecF [Mycolicibacterium chitae]VEG48475.1 preprotein translocase subunit SecF [Mycolicibacterium chitae]
MASKKSEMTTDSDLEVTESNAEEAPATDAALPQHGFFTRLYTGTGAFEVVGRRKMWFIISGLIVAIAIGAMLLRGFSFGIDFEGGTKISMPRGEVTVEQVETAFTDTIGTEPESVVIVGSGASATVQIRSESLDNDQTAALREALFEEFQPLGADGQPTPLAVSDSVVSETWGGQITQKALIALLVFVLIVTVYITMRYERYMAIAAMATMFFDLIVTAGIYALVGFEVTPATVIGLLTILGFSLYDTVIVFDKVEENTEGFEHTTRRTYAEQANLAVNQTFMRSINTSVISVLPIIALIVVAVWLLGVGTLKDLALVQLVGVIVGTYSSIFFATPLLVSLRERTEKVRNHTRRVERKRARAAGNTDADEPADKGRDEDTAAAAGDDSGEPAAAVAGTPAPGARPSRPSRPSAKRTGRPSGKRNPRP